MAYIVQQGDTLSKLYGSNWRKLSGYTGDPTKLQVGTKLNDLPNSNVITADSLSPTQPIKLPEAPKVDAPSLMGTAQGATNYVTELTKQLETAQKASESSQSDIIKTMNDLLNKQSDIQTATETTGLNASAKKLRELSAQASALSREAEAIPLQIQEQFKNTGATDTGVAPIQAGALRLNALKALSIAQQADIETANYNAAKDKAQQIIDLKYKPLEQELEIKKQQYEFNKDILKSIDAKRTEALNVALRKEEAELNEKKKREEDIQKMIIDASPNAPDYIIANAKSIADKGGSVLEVAQTLGKYGGDYLGNLIKKSTLEKNYAEIEKTRKEIKSMNENINTANLPSTPNGVAQKLIASAKNDKQLDATERQQLTKARTVLSQLDSLQSNIKKQNSTGFFKGKVGNLMEKIGLNADVGVINAQLQAITPNLARGVYGEVGVLTDNDVKLYRTTLPRLDRSQDQNDAVLALTMKTVQKSIENVLTGAANSGIDVSGWTQDYIAVTGKIHEIEDRIGVSKEAVNDIVRQDPKMKDVIKELYGAGLSDGEILDQLNAR